MSDVILFTPDTENDAYTYFQYSFKRVSINKYDIENFIIMADSLYYLHRYKYYLIRDIDWDSLISIKENADTISDEDLLCYTPDGSTHTLGYTYKIVKHFRTSLLNFGKMLKEYIYIFNIPSPFTIEHEINEYIQSMETNNYWLYSSFKEFVKLLKKSTYIPSVPYKEKLSFIRYHINNVTDEELERWRFRKIYSFRQALHVFNMWLKMYNV